MHTPRLTSISQTIFVVALGVLAACGSGAAANVVGTSAPSTSALTSNTVGSLSAKVNRKACLDVVGASSASGTAVQIWTCHGGENQSWQINEKSVQVYGTMCLTVNGTSNNAQVRIATCDSSDPQQAWHVNGTELIHDASGRCLDVRDGGYASGTKVQIYDCAKGNINQTWVMPNEQSTIPVVVNPNVSVADGSTPVTVPATPSTGASRVDASVDNAVTFSDWGIGGGFTAISLDQLLTLHPVLASSKQSMLTAAASSNPMVPPQLLVAVCLQESSGGLDTGSYGGPFQFTDDGAWQQFGPAGGDRNNMADAAKGAAAYLAYLIKANGGDLNAALRAYNGPISQGGNANYQANIQAWMSGTMVYGSGV